MISESSIIRKFVIIKLARYVMIRKFIIVLTSFISKFITITKVIIKTKSVMVLMTI